MEPPWEGGTKVYINGLGHMTTMPIYYGKTFKNLLLQNQKSYDLETWHVALGCVWYSFVKLYKFYINDDPGLTLTYFTCFVLTVGPDIR